MTDPDSARGMPPARHVALVPAAGAGTRLGAGRPKQYLDLGGSTMLERTVAALLACDWIERVLVVVSPDDTLAATLPGLADKRVGVSPVGGATRRTTVLGGLQALAAHHGVGPADWIWVHDAARPGVDIDSLSRLREALANERVGALLGLPMADTVKRGGGGRSIATVERDGLWVAQTPQVFGHANLVAALERHHDVTDEASAIEATGRSAALVPGSRRNFKVTTMDDLTAMREAFTEPEPRGAPRIGQGWDVHALVPGRALVIGGVTIPSPTGLLGHSDADVLLHAITDALFGAAALGDIGRHFPDTDTQFAGADSRVLLREAVARVRAAGWRPGNVDCTIVAQAPRMAPHVPAMVAAIADDLGIPASSVNVKAKTAERLGFAGRGEGIEAHATVMLVAARN
jgi:2-C-methyl-D-erythritol 4-phosphate cytidylyltransferase / 2-C-methyl-D-erythritol 2,4-cyclodiphosphate synthase